MDLPAETEGVPHTVFDSTGMVFAVMAQMKGGQGNVCKPYILVCCVVSASLSPEKILIRSSLIMSVISICSTFICTMCETLPVAPFPK